MSRALRAAEAAAGAVRVAFGPAGRGVLIRGPAGALTITRAAVDILEAAFPPSSRPGPELVVLLQGARALHRRTGDGVKGFLLTTAALLRGLESVLEAGPGLEAAASVRVRVELGRALPAAAAPRPDPGDLAASVLATRFTPDVAAAALPAVAALLRGSDSAALLRAHLPVLCRRRRAAGRAVADSAVREGVVVDGMLRFLGDGPERRVVAVLAGDAQDDAVDVRAAVSSLLADGAVDAGRLLVVTSAVLDDASLFALRRRGAALLHAVTPEDEHFLLEWALAARSGEVAVEVRGLERSSAWLGLPGVRQLQLHAPTQQLAEQLAAATRDAVQLMCFAADNGLQPALCPGGGSLERRLHRALGGTPLGRAELLRWHQQRQAPEARGPQHDQDPVVAALATALDCLSPDTRKAVAEAVAAVPRELPPDHPRDPPLEPAALRVAVLQHALATAGTLLAARVGITAASREGAARRPS
ncbi:hypothetical protein ONE63_006295 [Megalurothrips usitatus]|uniref:Uncharacterized protein n=1 Tax=Megalurothrips usitatus TaxID=439358 RepID=A0AAV7XSX7_9NEOP|nr:hypothetical protein ONE63_006295 [Megalurothrips usitatus]